MFVNTLTYCHRLRTNVNERISWSKFKSTQGKEIDREGEGKQLECKVDGQADNVLTDCSDGGGGNQFSQFWPYHSMFVPVVSVRTIGRYFVCSSSSPPTIMMMMTMKSVCLATRH